LCARTFIEKSLLPSLSGERGRAIGTAIQRMRYGERDLENLLQGFYDPRDLTTRAQVFSLLSAAMNRVPLKKPVLRRIIVCGDEEAATEEDRKALPISTGEEFFDGVLLRIDLDPCDKKRLGLGLLPATPTVQYCTKYDGEDNYSSWQTYLGPIAITRQGGVSLMASVSSGSSSSSGSGTAAAALGGHQIARLTFRIVNYVEPPRIVLPCLNQESTGVPIFRDALEVKVAAPTARGAAAAAAAAGAAAAESPLERSLLYAIEKVDMRPTRLEPYHGPVMVREPGEYRITATAAIRGPVSRRWYTSTPAVESPVKVVRSCFKIPKAIVKGALTVVGVTRDYLRKNEVSSLPSHSRSHPPPKQYICPSSFHPSAHIFNG
jgi:hypothetical protein